MSLDTSVVSKTIEGKVFSINQSQPLSCWRLVYDTKTKKVLSMFESSGITKTINGLFCSSQTQSNIETGESVISNSSLKISSPVTTENSGFLTSDQGKAECQSQMSSLGLLPLPPV